MNDPLDVICPACGNVMEVVTEEGMRICPTCAALVWNDEDGTVETRAAHKIEGEELHELIRGMKFVSIEEERARVKKLIQRNPHRRPH